MARGRIEGYSRVGREFPSFARRHEGALLVDCRFHPRSCPERDPFRLAVRGDLDLGYVGIGEVDAETVKSAVLRLHDGKREHPSVEHEIGAGSRDADIVPVLDGYADRLRVRLVMIGDVILALNAATRMEVIAPRRELQRHFLAAMAVLYVGQRALHLGRYVLFSVGPDAVGRRHVYHNVSIDSCRTAEQ